MQIDERVRGMLGGGRFQDVRLLAVTDSTNRVARELADEGAPEGIVVAADHQTAGRGRLDRTWDEEPGSSLLVTVLLRPQGLERTRWHLLTAAAGIAGQDACRLAGRFEPELKWPNDLLVGGRKLAGILAETSGDAVVVGMGLNVHGAPPGAAWADDAAGRRVGRTPLLVAWLLSYDRLLSDWDRLAALYRERCSTIGRLVVVDRGPVGMVEGRAEGIDDSGRLLVRPHGSPEAVEVAAGDVTHLRDRERGRP